MKKILFIDTVHESLQITLEAKGFLCVDGSMLAESEILTSIHQYNGIIIRSRFFIGKEILEKAVNLEFIARAGAGMENIDVTYASSKNIQCFNAPEGNRNAVAEQALGMLLLLFNNLTSAHNEVCNNVWIREGNRGIELDGRTVGIIGFGNTGSTFARKLQGFDINILVHDPYININEKEFRNVKQTSLDTLLQKSDVISLHVPLTDETRWMVNSEFINKAQKPFYLINTSRGKVVKTEAVVAGLETNKILGAALDVLEYESLSFESLPVVQMPEVFKRLTKFKNVILTPHIAGWTMESHRKISEVLAKKIITFYFN